MVSYCLPRLPFGSADFAGECKQSRATVSPLALYQGNDHALPLRRNMTLAMKSFNELIEAGSLQLEGGTRIPCEPLVVGDMQGVKCIMGMTESCHAVWCKCKARGVVESGDSSPQATARHKRRRSSPW